MKIDQYSQIIYDEQDICNFVMQGHDYSTLRHLTVDPELDLDTLMHVVDNPQNISTWLPAVQQDISLEEFDKLRQSHWFMPDEYQQLDIAKYVLSLCVSQQELQRVGQELLLFQKHDMFDLLKFLKYLVDKMRDADIIWGVGRGSSVASYVLYLLGVHKIDSLYYDLDPSEFLR